MHPRTPVSRPATLWVLCLSLAFAPLLRAAILPHSPLVPTTEELRRLARVRTLLATSTPTRRNPVHIVFYGQSITLGAWWTEVAAELRRLYPFADLRIDNKAISGFQDWALARSVQADLLPLQPDLVIFHAYGTANGTDLFLDTLRAGTIAEVIVQTDHPHLNDALEEETDPAKIARSNLIPYRNYVGLVDDTDRHGACLARVRDAWKAYCRSNALAPSKLLADGIHPTADGYHLMAEFVLAYLRPDTSAPTLEPWNCPRVRSVEVGTEAAWHDGVLECDFTGNTVMATLAGPLTGDIEVWIDGQRAAALPALLGFNRVSPTHYSGWPTLSQVGSRQPLLEETWTLTPFNLTGGGMNFAFRVEGSLTGPDGEGTNTVRFVSKSGRVVIEVGDHWIPFAVHYSGKKPLPDGFRATWQAERHFLDPLPAGLVPPADFGRRLRLVQGLADGPHRLRLVNRGVATPNLTALRAYSPGGRAAIRDTAPHTPQDTRLQVVTTEFGPALSWPVELTGWRLEYSGRFSAVTEWQSVPTRDLQTVGTRLHYPLSAVPASRFFRLRAPVGTVAPNPAPPGNPPPGTPEP